MNWELQISICKYKKTKYTLKQYLFQSERLGFRNWQEADKVAFSKMNADPAVMEYFPTTKTKEESDKLVDRLNDHFLEKGLTFYAVDQLKNGEFVGFIGLIHSAMETDFTPCVEIGWRLKKAAWGKGYATEGAIRCLEYGFNDLDLKEIYSFTPLPNKRSERVMQKIGMTKIKEFGHPWIDAKDPLFIHVLYRKEKTK